VFGKRYLDGDCEECEKDIIDDCKDCRDDSCKEKCEKECEGDDCTKIVVVEVRLDAVTQCRACS
jgi:hypothetical protein